MSPAEVALGPRSVAAPRLPERRQALAAGAPVRRSAAGVLRSVARGRALQVLASRGRREAARGARVQGRAVRSTAS